jgi:GT2 family glycosyltransferase
MNTVAHPLGRQQAARAATTPVIAASPECSVVIHSFNRRAMLDRALRALVDGAGPETLEVIVADSGSTDGSREWVKTRFPQVRLVELPGDRGLAAGRNAGLRAARGAFILVMDEDVVVTRDQVLLFAELMRTHPEAGLLACCKVDERGEALYQYHVPLPSSLNLWFFIVVEWSLQEALRMLRRRFELGARRPHEDVHVAEIPFIGGALLFARSEAIAQVGLFDEHITFYGEDFDWCFRFRARGWKILYFPQIAVQAFHGTNSQRTMRASLVALRSRRYLFSKHVGARYLPFYAALAGVGLIPKGVYYLLQRLRGRREDLSVSRWLWYALRTIAGLPPALTLKG